MSSFFFLKMDKKKNRKFKAGMRIFADTKGDESQSPLTSNIFIDNFFQRIYINLPKTKKINHLFEKTTKKNHTSSDNSDDSSDSDHESDEEKNINNKNTTKISEDSNSDSDVDNILEIDNRMRKRRKIRKDDTKYHLINGGRKKRKSRASYNN